MKQGQITNDTEMGNPSALALINKDVEGNVVINGNTKITPAGQVQAESVNAPAASFTHTADGILRLNMINYADAATLLTLTFPAAFDKSDFIQVVGIGVGGFKVAQLSSQLVRMAVGSTTTGTGGSISSGSQFDIIRFRCIVSNTTWNVEYQKGSLIFV